MANHDSAKKAYRQTLKKTEINRSRVSKIRTFIKKVDAAIVSGLKEEAMKALSAAQSEIMKGVKKGLIKLNAGSRKVGRLSAKIKRVFAA
jgi:small subunit ribosomal protein S20